MLFSARWQGSEPLSGRDQPGSLTKPRTTADAACFYGPPLWRCHQASGQVAERVLGALLG